MRRIVSIHNRGFVVTDDPDGVIGNALDMIVNNLDWLELAALLGPGGESYSIDTVGSVARVEERDDLPEPWDQDQSLDPETTELWALYRDPDRECGYVTRTLVITGDELRELVAQALALSSPHHRMVKWDGCRFLVTHDRDGVIGSAITFIVGDLDLAQIGRDLAPDGPGCAVDGLGAVTRAGQRADLPSPWDQAPTIEPAQTELWVLRVDPARDPHNRRNAFVITGDELRALVAQAVALRPRRSL